MRWLVFWAMLGVVLAGCASAAPADVRVSGVWARPNDLLGSTASVYLTLTNAGGTADGLLSAGSPVAEGATLHETRVDNEVASMHDHGGAIAIPAGGEVVFAPNGLHVMLVGLREPLVAGGSFPLTLTFESGKVVTTTVTVRGE